MIKFVNAKINLGLQVLRRRPDGYHDLSTIFIPVGMNCGMHEMPGNLCDILEITPAIQDSLTVTGSDFSCMTEQNLVWKALVAYRKKVPALPPIAITLEKHLPSGAGMGGGSADAAFALLMLDELAGKPLAPQELSHIALSLGADVPFFLINTPCLASGIGEILSPVKIPQLTEKWIVIIKPSEGISTSQAFGLITPHVPEVALTDAIQCPMQEWKHVITNDFERSMFTIHPDLSNLKQFLYDHGALYASMTGSGSAFFGIFGDEQAARRCAENAPTPFATFTKL